MKKSLWLLGLFLIFSVDLFSKSVDTSRAQVVAGNFLSHRAEFVNSKNLDVALMHIRFASDGTLPLYYCFSASENGFIIISADDCVYPVLAYSENGRYDPADVSPEFRYWMDMYAKQIEEITARGLAAGPAAEEAWKEYSGEETSPLINKSTKSVSPLLTSTWNQGAYYNFLCPEDPDGPGGHVWSGCVATAMAQLMYYYRYPLQGTGSHGYYSDYGYLFADFGNTVYDWNSMMNDISHSFNYEMALIQYHCGIAVDMMYAPDGSGAYMWDATQAMIDYFGYNPSAQLLQKDNYTSQQWMDMLENSLDNKHPVAYAGYGSGGGHAFVCDGYQGGGFFHFNWGWGGTADGYFYTDNLNPGYDFSNGQQAIFDMYPAQSYPYGCSGTTVLDQMSGSIEDGSGPVENYSQGLDCRWVISPSAPVQKIILNFSRFDTENSNDIVTVYDGDLITSPVLGSFSGASLPVQLSSTGAKMLIRFQTNASAQAPGWLAGFRAVPLSFCDDMTEMTAPSGVISDGSGSNDYNNSTFCRWRIAPPGAHSISISFSSFDIEPVYDFVKVYDQTSNIEIASFSGSSLPSSLTVYTDKVLLLFKSDFFNTAPGWEAFYTSSESAIDENNSISSICISPVPAQTSVRLQAAVDGNSTCRILMQTLSGTQLFSRAVIPSDGIIDEKIDVESYAPGMYFLILQTGDKSYTEKIIIR